MCGGAVISDYYIPTGRSHRLTADYLWPDLKGAAVAAAKKGTTGYSKPLRSGIANVDDDDAVADQAFEADFLEFKDESDDEVSVLPEFKPFSFALPKPKSPTGMLISSFFYLVFLTFNLMSSLEIIN